MKSDVFAEMEQDALTEAPVPTDKALKGLAKLAHQQIELENRITNGEEHLKNLKKDLETLATKTIPSAMDDIGIPMFKTSDGYTVEIKPFVSATISKAKKEECHAWLIKNKHGDLIKRIMAVGIGKNAKLAKEIEKFLKSKKIVFETTEAVHSGTLKAFVKEQVAAGVSFPLELFGAFIGQKSTIKKD